MPKRNRKNVVRKTALRLPDHAQHPMRLLRGSGLDGWKSAQAILNHAAALPTREEVPARIRLVIYPGRPVLPKPFMKVSFLSLR